MKGLVFVFIYVLFFCGVSALTGVSQSSGSVSEVVHTVKDALDIKRELDEIRGSRRRNGKKRARRYSFISPDYIKKAHAGVHALLKTYLYQPIAHGNFLESTIRGYDMLRTNEGRFVFGSLDGELNQTFRSLMRDGHPRTGDIISCRIPSIRMAEHYMMVMNNKIVEVGVAGGKDTHNGGIIIDSYRNSSYINSTECLYHENRLISKANEIDERNGNDKETEQRYQEILDRLLCTIDGKNSGQFNYDLITCNCQDLVLYWAYGYTENNCLKSFFNGCSEYLTSSLPQILNVISDEATRDLLKVNINDFFIDDDLLDWVKAGLLTSLTNG